MSSFATLYADGCARPPAIQATLKVTNASRPQIAAMRGGTSETVAFRAFDGPCEVHARGDVGFPEDVAQVRLDRLLAEEQLRCDLGVRLSVDDQARDLQLTRGQSFEPGRAVFARCCPAVDAVAELAQLALGLCTPAQSAARFECCCRVLQLRNSSLTLAALRQCAPGQCAREGCLDRRSDLLSPRRRQERPFGRRRGTPRVEVDRRRRS